MVRSMQKNGQLSMVEGFIGATNTSKLNRGAANRRKLVKVLRLVVCIFTFCSLQCSFPLLYDCEEEVISQSMSPNQEYAATLVERNCGATTGYAAIVRMHPVSAISTDDQDMIFAVDGDYEIKMEWSSNSSLRIICEKCIPNDIYKQENMWRDIEITY